MIQITSTNGKSIYWKFGSRIVIFLFLFLLSIVVSVFVYIGIYWFWIPKVSHEYPLHFHFHSTINTNNIHDSQYSTTFDIYKYNNNNNNQNGATSIVELDDGYSTSGYGYGNNRGRLINGLKGILSTSQAYDFHVELLMPKNPHNLQIGNFMIGLKLVNFNPSTANIDNIANNNNEIPDKLNIDSMNNEQKYHSHILKYGKVLYQSSRAAILEYTSPFVSSIRTLLLTPLIILNLSPDSHHHLRLNLLSDVFESPTNPLTHAIVTIEPGINTGKIVHVYGGRILISARFRGLRYLMYHLAFPSALVFIALLSMAFLFLFCSIWFYVEWKLSSFEYESHGRQEVTSPSLEDEYRTDILNEKKKKKTVVNVDDDDDDDDLSLDSGKEIMKALQDRQSRYPTPPPDTISTQDFKEGEEGEDDDDDDDQVEQEEFYFGRFFNEDSDSSTKSSI